jgi:hypothetical protein
MFSRIGTPASRGMPGIQRRTRKMPQSRKRLSTRAWGCARRGRTALAEGGNPRDTNAGPTPLPMTYLIQELDLVGSSEMDSFRMR